MADEILYAVADSIATITLNRPERRNALNTALMEALAHRFDALESDTSVRAVVIRGAGQAFCSGRDLNEMSRRQDDGLEPEADVIALFQQIEASRHPTIAMVHGAAYAGGCELALRERVEHKDLDEIARRARASADAREGVRAMLEHRTPTFRGQ